MANFKLSEFRCKCRRASCDAVPMDPSFIAMLEKIREAFGLPMIVTSGVRCAYWNEQMGGAPKSTHLKGIAADIKAVSPQVRDKLIKLAEAHGVGGIGIAKTFVHLDGRARAEGRPAVRWGY